MICPQCKNKLPDGLIACFRCGFQLRDIENEAIIANAVPLDRENQINSPTSKNKLLPVIIAVILLIGCTFGGHFLGFYSLPFLSPETVADRNAIEPPHISNGLQSPEVTDTPSDLKPNAPDDNLSAQTDPQEATPGTDPITEPPTMNPPDSLAPTEAAAPTEPTLPENINRLPQPTNVNFNTIHGEYYVSLNWDYPDNQPGHTGFKFDLYNSAGWIIMTQRWDSWDEAKNMRELYSSSLAHMLCRIVHESGSYTFALSATHNDHENNSEPVLLNLNITIESQMNATHIRTRLPNEWDPGWTWYDFSGSFPAAIYVYEFYDTSDPAFIHYVTAGSAQTGSESDQLTIGIHSNSNYENRTPTELVIQRYAVSSYNASTLDIIITALQEDRILVDSSLVE